MANQLVMYEEELQQINNICEVLHRDSNAMAVLVIDKNGQAIADAGEVEQLDVTSLSSLTAGNVAATGGIATLLQEKEFAGQFHEGERTNVHISIVGGRVILLVLFDERSSLGLVRLRVRKSTVELEKVLETLVQKSAESPQNSILAEITDEDIDSLFND
jgi:predicted regulator of Ras-like GTPase activity (Roadblock/LC7/MglB family)